MNREHPDGAATFCPGPMTTRLEDALSALDESLVRRNTAIQTGPDDEYSAACNAADEAVWELARAAIAALSATPQAEPDTESADFKEGFAVGRAEAQSLAASIKHPACGQCGATCAKDAEAKCRPSGDSCPGVEWPLADLWALQQPATPQAAQVPAGYALVPVEPTEAMVRAVFNVLPDRRLEGGIRRQHRRRYIAMLAAAQAQGACP